MISRATSPDSPALIPLDDRERRIREAVALRDPISIVACLAAALEDARIHRDALRRIAAGEGNLEEQGQAAGWLEEVERWMARAGEDR